MRLTLAPTLLGLSSPTGSLLQRLLGHVLEADARYREARRFDDLPNERLRDIGLRRPAAGGLLKRPESWG